ncbi:unnamed protein product [Lactuca virosa]|uniref:Ubiquitin-like protease family profile domain-containing protein n=1 Tax=Lactuca virosa TaxID=75947 RepID=A0AAU9NZP5_9ASTR|nr:unnamed protein product [Lactuca virosa]
MESLIPDCRIHQDVIDFWSAFLNDLEKFKGNTTPLRFFMSCSLMKTDSINARLVDRIRSHVETFSRVKSLRVNLKTMLKQYLTITDHPRVNSFKIMKMERFEMEWQTKNNDVYCGLFLTRHMKVYRGGGVEKTDADILHECTSQKMQLVDMMKKYVGKILLSDLNLCKPSFVTTLEDYVKLMGYKRKKIYIEGHFHELEVRVQSTGVL